MLPCNRCRIVCCIVLTQWNHAQARSDGREMTEAEHEEMRLKRIQEKNRRNQRKFRARQRVSAGRLRPACFAIPVLAA